MYGETYKCAFCGSSWGFDEQPAHLPDCQYEGFSIACHESGRAELLKEAGDLIAMVGERGKAYGDADGNFTRIARGWSEILGVDVNKVQVALCMDWVKTCRLITSPSHRDSWIDKIGYSALGGEVADK
jgi:hypothetical protein